MIYCMRTRIFFSVNNKDYLLVTNYRIIEFLSSHGVSRTVTGFFFTRNIADSHGFSFLSRIRELSNFCLHTEYHGLSRIFFSSFLVPNYRIIEFLSSHGISRTVTGFFLVPNFRIFEFYLFVPRLVLCPETCPWTH